MKVWSASLVALGVFLHASVLHCRAAVLTNIADVLALSGQRIADELPVHVNAVVTYADPSGGILFVEDRTGGVAVRTRLRVPAYRSGEVVEILGTAQPGSETPTIAQATLKVRGHQSLEPALADLDGIVAGAFEHRFIEMAGVVRQVRESRGRTTLVIEVANGRIIEAEFIDIARVGLWDALVSVRGVCSLRRMNDGRAAQIVLSCSGPEALMIDFPGLPDAFAAELRNLADIDESGVSSRVRVDGTVVTISESGAATIASAGGERFSLETAGNVLLRTNDSVQVTGFPTRSEKGVSFRFMEVRPVAPLRDSPTNGPVMAPVFTRASVVRRLGARADRGYGVRIRGVVTYYDREWMLFVQDETAGIYVYPGQEKFPLRAGQLVEVTGHSHSGLYAPVINEPTFTILSDNQSVEAKPVTAETLLRGEHDSQRVELSGVVCSVNLDITNVAWIELATTAGRIPTAVLLDGRSLSANLVDAEVRVRGVCGSSYNQHKQFVGAKLYVATPDDLTVERPVAPDAFPAPAQSITNLLQFGSASLHRVKVAGTVIFADPRALLLCVQDSSGGAFVQLRSWPRVKRGDVIEALGFPATGGYTPTLTQADVLVVGTGRPVQAKVIRAEDALSHDAELVSLDARVLDSVVSGTNEILIVQSGTQVFEAQLPRVHEGGVFANIEPQSVVRLTGVCSVILHQSSAPRGIRVLLRSPGDVAVLSTPPWWEDRRMRTLACLAGVLVLTPIVWVMHLRRKVREQTGVIRAQLEGERQSNEELEARIAERTTALSRANKDLEEARDSMEMRVDERTAELLYANDMLTNQIAVRERSERALRMSEERFQLVGRATNDAIRDFDVQNNQLWWGEGFESLFGYKRSEVEPGLESWISRVHPDERNRVLTGIHASLDSGSVSWTEEYRFRCGDGSYRHIFDRGYVIRNADGEPIRVVGAMMDISASKRVEESLRLSEERFSKAFRCSPVPMSISALADGRYIDLNDAYARMLGFTREEMLGRTSVELGIWKDSAQRQNVIQQVADLKTVHDGFVDLHTRTGETRHALASAETISINNVECLLAILNDITERRQLEAQFRQAQKMEAVGQLAAGIAHDFNNLLTVILGNVALSQIGGCDQATAMTEIADAADRAASLTRQLLTFSRKQQLRPQVLHLKEVITGMSRLLQRVLGEQITLCFDHLPALPPVRCDRGMIEQIVMNLAVNARDAMPDGGRLTFTTSVATVTEEHLQRNAEAAVGAFVCVAISDTGCGMDDATVGRIFEPFFTTKEVGKGTGLGLATVYGIVKQHGGWIEVFSEPGRGTKFEIYFPALPQEIAAPRGSRIDAPIRGGTEIVLVVEDETGVRNLARDILKRFGYQVLLAADGPEAIQVWHQHKSRIDLLLTDMVMPNGISGRELADRFLAERPELKVIYTSGYSVEFGGTDLPLDETVNFLPKPYPAQRLASFVRQCLDSPPASASTHSTIAATAAS